MLTDSVQLPAILVQLQGKLCLGKLCLGKLCLEMVAKEMDLWWPKGSRCHNEPCVML